MLPYHFHIPLKNIDSLYNDDDVVLHMKNCDCHIFDSVTLKFSTIEEAKNTLLHRNKNYVNNYFYVNDVKFNYHGKADNLVIPLFYFNDFENKLEEEFEDIDELLYIKVKNEQEIIDILFNNDYYICDYYILFKDKLVLKNISCYYETYCVISFDDLLGYLLLSSVDTNTTLGDILKYNLKNCLYAQEQILR